MPPTPRSERDALRDPTREEARLHIEEHALGEAERISKLSRVRELVLGFQDGLLVPLGVVTGMAAANPGRPAILVAGLAEAVAGCIAMGGGSYGSWRRPKRVRFSRPPCLACCRKR